MSLIIREMIVYLGRRGRILQGFVQAFNLTNQRNIVWGRNYVVETDEIRVTKRLQICPDDKNCVMAYSTNTSTYPDGTLIHQPFKIHKEDIRQVFLVLGSINKEYGSEPVFSLR